MTSGVAFECGFAQKSNISLRMSAYLCDLCV
jgi:hypothetical protein